MFNLTIDMLREAANKIFEASPKERLIVTNSFVVDEMISLGVPLQKIPGRRAYTYLGTTYLVFEAMPREFAYVLEK